AIDFAAGDFRGDGTMGVAAVDTQGRLSVTVWNGENDFQPIYPQQGPPVSLVGAGTFDGNSQSEALYFTGSTCWTWKWTGANQFGNFLKSQLPVAPTALTTGDFNGDGKLDWAGTDPDSGTVIAAAGDGKGGFTAAPGSPYVVGGTPYAIVAADFNGDGKSDLAVDTGSDVVILLNSNPYAGGTLLFVSSVVNAASYAAGTVAPESYAAAFGSKLAASAGDPTVAVTIVDATGRRAAASVVYASPGQVNFLVPAGLAAGAGGLQISNSLGSSVLAPLTVAPVAPGLFTVDSAGKVPAAQVVSLDANNHQTFQPVANCAGNSCTLAPIVLNPADQNYLILYGTGIRGNGGTSGVTVMLGGDEAPVAYAGPQGQYPGLDQVNVQIPQSFGVQGKVTITLSIGSIGPPAASNSVEVEFR
ncbi:MAG TPA: FG-GAP-like repeat-containing protein, partial [Bryobacteraceae bacterium]|nr:FG-GAP-like repeat-containing protein [Bryobacteraceae bacterium]